jgi:hypothetical protein
MLLPPPRRSEKASIHVNPRVQTGDDNVSPLRYHRGLQKPEGVRVIDYAEE